MALCGKIARKQMEKGAAGCRDAGGFRPNLFAELQTTATIATYCQPNILKCYRMSRSPPPPCYHNSCAGEVAYTTQLVPLALESNQLQEGLMGFSAFG